MNKKTSLWAVQRLSLCLITMVIVSPAAQAREEKTLTAKTELRPVGWKEGRLWFAPGSYWVDDVDKGVQSGTLAETKSLKVWNSQGLEVKFAPGFIRFEAAGGVKIGTLAEDTELKVVNTASPTKTSVIFAGKTAVEFGYDGGVMNGTLAKEATLKTQNGQMKSYPAGTHLDFDGAGMVTKAIDAPPTVSAALDGTYTGKCTMTLLPEITSQGNGVIPAWDKADSPFVDGNGEPALTFVFSFKAASGSFKGGVDTTRYSLQWEGNYGATGTIVNGRMTGWVDVFRGSQKLRWTVRGPINGTLKPALPSTGTLSITTAGGRELGGGSFTGALGAIPIEFIIDPRNKITGKMTWENKRVPLRGVFDPNDKSLVATATTTTGNMVTTITIRGTYDQATNKFRLTYMITQTTGDEADQDAGRGDGTAEGNLTIQEGPLYTWTGIWTATRGTPDKRLFANGNIGGVSNKPTKPTVFTVKKGCTITSINDYHWNDSKGTPAPGQISIKHQDGTVYGPWNAVGSPGQGGVRNAYWECRPNVPIKEGTYTVIDSDPATWSQNAESGGQGFTEVRGTQDAEEPSAA